MADYEYYQKITENGLVNEANLESEKLYYFDGHILKFGKDIGLFRAQTRAKSKKKAWSNLLFQAKKKCNVNPNNSSITITGKLTEVDGK